MRNWVSVECVLQTAVIHGFGRIRRQSPGHWLLAQFAEF
jgi:hypothetical protein